MKTTNPYLDGSRILLGGHRGDRQHYPENTMPAMISAVEMGCDAIETDVRRTKDGHLILIHDRDVARTTNGQGNVDEMTLEEIRALEEKYAKAWLDMDFDDEAITMAYERTCLNTGGLSWAYMNKILLRWHEAGFHTAADIRAGDRKGSTGGQRQLDADEQAAIRKMMQED